MRLKLGPWGPHPADAPPKAGPGAMPEAGREAQLACAQCGAVLAYAPDTQELTCGWCGHSNRITVPVTEIVEECLETALAEGVAAAPEEETHTVKCESCAAEFSFDPSRHAGSCPFCGHSIVSDTGVNRHLKPAALLPFTITDREARERVRRWLRGLWFAPNRLKTYARDEGRLAGVYLPYWTFDSFTQTRYRGRRGDFYMVPVQVRNTVNGRPVTQTQMVQKVRWRPVSGEVSRHFDDVLVLASRSLPNWMTDRLEPWDLADLKPYTPQFIAGFQAEAYQIGLEEGFAVASAKMQARIAADVRLAIGGDMQQIERMNVRHANRTFKHILLPCWLGAFLFGGKSYRLCVNARTGAVQGERPYSWIKVTAAVLLALILFAIAATVVTATG